MNCPNCQTENPSCAQFCGVCGHNIKINNDCSKCGHCNHIEFKFYNKCGQLLTVQITLSPPSTPTKQSPSMPTSFVNGRYTMKKFFSEGSKKKLYLAYDTVLDRDVAFTLFKTETLDETARERVTREAQAMGKRRYHPNIMTIFDTGEEKGQPYVVLPLMIYVDFADFIKLAPEHCLPIPQTIKITQEDYKGLEYTHGKGITHQEMKPGNVMLGTDSMATINDFEVALTVDLYSLDKAGLSVLRVIFHSRCARGGFANYLATE